MAAKKRSSRFSICVKSDGYPASLEVHKVYRVLSDPKAQAHDMVRIVDESGEDYLYPNCYFVPIELPRPVSQSFKTVAGSSG